jgi:hypothetical protein
VAYEHFLIPPDKTVKKPKAPRPLLTESFRIAGSAERSGQPRGQVKIAFDTDGRLHADWQCSYTSDDKPHSFTSQMAGNVCVKMDYEDKTGTDETRLFFFGKGNYVHFTAVPETETTRENGTVYLIGWLKPDRSAEGPVTITTDQKWSLNSPLRPRLTSLPRRSLPYRHGRQFVHLRTASRRLPKRILEVGHFVLCDSDL